MNGKRKRLMQILKDRSILRGKFKLASGNTTDHYIDGRLTTLDSEGLSLSGEIFLQEILKDPNISAVGGPTIGADPIVGSVLTHSALKNIKLSGFLVRKEAKQHGTGKLIEGNLKKGDRVAVLEDVVTTGGSILKAIDAVQSMGIKVSKILAILDREEGARENLRERGYEFYSIFKLSDLMK